MAKRKRDHRFFDSWCRKMCMVPVGREVEPEGDILLADSPEPFVGSNEAGIISRWYRTGFAIERDGETWFAFYHEYPAVDYDLVSREEGRKRRIRDCMHHARQRLKETAATGIYDHGKRASFSQRPN